MRKLPTRKLLGALIAGALFLPDVAFTLGLGEIEVKSALNQKLKADIELLSATPEDTENIIVKLASRKEFLRAGLDRPYLLSDLSFKSVVINDTPYIAVSSSSPIREPFLNFLVEVDWPNGHLLREYTVLLDPPVFMTQPASTASAPVNQAASAGFRPSSGGSTNVVPVIAPGVAASTSSRPAGMAPVAPESQQVVSPAFMPAPVVQQQTSINQPAGSYRIKTGDTAWSLAEAMRPDQSITVEQMMIAMLRSNPESFINENVNGLKRGYILRVPDYNQIASISQADARAMVREQAALWRQYQQSQSTGQPVSAMESDAAASTSSSGESAGMTAEDEAYLEIVSAGSGSSTMSGKDPTEMSAQELRAELALVRERVETERVEKEALQQRIDTLEQHVSTMKGMLSIEDQELSEVQSLNLPDQDQEALAAGQEAITEEAATEADAAVADELAEIAETEAMTDEMAEELAELADAVVAEEDAVDTAAEETAEQEAVFADETLAEESAEAAAAMPEQAEPVAEDIIVSEPQVMEREPADPLSKLLSDPMMLAAAGGGLLLIAALIGLIIKRRKGAVEDVVPAEEMGGGEADLESLADDLAAEAEELVEEEAVVESLAGEQPAEEEAEFDPNATMTQDATEDTVVTEADTAAGDEDEARDDVIAEADVYLAYGIYQQAEELLMQAIADNPERDDYRVKLAETHYAGKNADAFVEVANEIKKRAGSDDTPAWKKVMVMGQDLCADNPMFQGSMVGGLDVDAMSPKTPEMDFDLGIDEPASNEDKSDLDLSLDEESLELPEADEAEETTEVQAMDELEFDLNETGAVEESAAAEDEFSLDIDASELDIAIEDEAEAVSESSEESIVLDEIDIGLDDEEQESVDEVLDVGDIDFGLDEEEATETAEIEEAEDVALDLSDEVESLEEEELLGMDLAEEPEVATKAAAEVVEEIEEAPVAGDEFIDDEDFDLSSLDDVDEISTKLDLARAYLDMGDHEGTKGILEEVLAEGNDEQKQEANELMAKLD